MYATYPQWMNPHTSARSHLPTAQQLYDSPFNFASYKPEEIGHLSRRAGRSYCNDARNKRYLRNDAQQLSNVSFDLLRGYPHKYIRASIKRSQRSMNHILSWWVACGGQQLGSPGGAASFPTSSRPLNFDFVVRRGHLAKVLVTPHVQYGWKLAVTLFRGTYFLLEVAEDEDFTEARDRIDYMGHKFEHYMTSATPGQAPDPSGVLDLNDGFYSISKVSLKSHSLLLCAEVDSEDPTVRYLKAPATYVELKTTQGDPENVSSIKKLRWWAQSFLGGIPRIIAGFKRDDRTVEKCRIFQVTQDGLTQTVSRSWAAPDFWKPAVCMNFLDAFLSFVKEVVTEDNPE
ncbi:decapping and exoribonuclease protein-like isoform X2 [Ambystoma mexicanum]